MNRNLLKLVIFGMLFCVLVGTAFAAETDLEADDDSYGGKAHFYVAMVMTCILGMAAASSLCGWAQSRAITSAMDAISRQPSAAKDIQTILIIGLSLIEALGLYTLVVALVFIFTVNPF